ncbi:hypothetical protein ACKWTF_003636 [Chironomus riparius]
MHLKKDSTTSQMCRKSKLTILVSKYQNNLIKSQCHSILGPPDESSNIRPILRYAPDDETHLQKKLRLKRIDAEQFVSGFWKNHNKRFFTEKSNFIAERQGDKELNADEMSEFYKKFLDKNWESHFYFNIMWYMKNFELLYLALLVNVQKGIRKIKN